MVDRISKATSGLAEEAIRAALRAQERQAEGIQDAAQEIFQRSLDALGSSGQGAAGGVQAAATGTRAEASSPLAEGLREVNAELRKAEELPEALVRGEVTDFHEVATQVRRADLSFKFALEVRNKLVEAYREVMRMNV